MIVDWGVHVLGKAITTVKDIFTGETGRRLGSHLWDVYEAAGGGRNGRYAVAKTIALLAVPRPDMCIRAIYKGSGREISSECGQAALEVLPFIKACRLAREAEGAGELGSAGAAARLRYEASPKHGRVRRGRSNPAPVNGQEALDFSIPLGPNTPRRIGIDYETGEFVVFHRTREGVYHGHVRTWGELTPQMQATLRRGGLVDKRGRITIGK